MKTESPLGNTVDAEATSIIATLCPFPPSFVRQTAWVRLDRNIRIIECNTLFSQLFSHAHLISCQHLWTRSGMFSAFLTLASSGDNISIQGSATSTSIPSSRPRLRISFTICWVQVVPDLGKVAMKTSPSRTAKWFCWYMNIFCSIVLVKAFILSSGETWLIFSKKVWVGPKSVELIFERLHVYTCLSAR